MITVKLRSDLSTGMLPIAQQSAAKYQLNKFLKEMPQGTKAYIAGGAPRDWHHGIGCRDVDIFYQQPPVPERSTEELIRYMRFFKKCNNLGQHVGNYYFLDTYEASGQGIIGLHEYPVYQGALRHRKVQLIELNRDPLEVIKDFPINLSRIWMDRSGKIECHRDYAWGYNNGFLWALHDKQYYYPYIEKILGRYSRYGFIPHRWMSAADRLNSDRYDPLDID